MSDSLRARSRPEDPYARITGSVLVLGGLAVFLIVFLTLFPILRDPVSTYSQWFPLEKEEELPDEAEPAAPRAGFYWMVEAREPGEGEGAGGEERRPVLVARFEDRSEAGDAPITRWTWELGDGTFARGPDVDHEYAEPGGYRVRLEVEDENGQTDRTDGRIAAPEGGREEGEIEPEGEILDLSGIEASIEDLVGTLTKAVKASVVIGLFALAASVLTLVGGQVIRAGVMLLRPLPIGSPKARRLKERQVAAADSEAAAGEAEQPGG